MFTITTTIVADAIEVSFVPNLSKKPGKYQLQVI